MSKHLKLLLFILSGLVAIPALVGVVLLQFLDLESFRQQLEERASEASGMRVSMAGPMHINLFPKIQVVLNELRVDKEGRQIAFVNKVSVGFDLLPLFYKELQINSIALLDPVVSIARLQDGSFNIRKPERYAGTLPTLDLESISVVNGIIHFDDALAGAKYEARSCDIDVTDLVLIDSSREDVLQHLSLAAELGCREAIKDAVILSDVKAFANGSAGKFAVAPITMNLFGAAGSGSVEADFSSASPGYELQYSLPQFQAESFLAAFFPQQTITGNMDFLVDLSMHGTTLAEAKQSLSGSLSLRGKNLTLHGINLDEELAEFASTQNFTLVDVSALFFAGPLGLAVTKGYDYASLFQKSESNSEITSLVSDWTVANGIAQPLDAAMTTNENLMALKGGLDFYNGQFNDMTIALLDATGCASVQQVIRGSFREPEIEKPGFLMTLAAPAISLLKQGVELLPGEECEPFYEGSLLRSQ